MDVFEKNISEFAKQLTEKNLTGANLGKLSGARADGIIIMGMGGSGLASEVLRGVEKEIGLNLPIVIWKDYNLPEHNFKKPLYIFVSFSGNTEETISGIKTLFKKRSARMAVVASGGELKNLAQKKNIPLAYFSAGSLTPRQSIGIMFYGLTKILKAAGLNVRVKDYSKVIKPEQFRNEGKKLAASLRNRIVVIYTDEAHRHLGYIWKIKTNENAKSPAFNNVLPEMDHNEIVGFENKNFKTTAIFLKNDSSHVRIKKRFKITEELLKEKGACVIELELKGKTELEKAWKMMLLADWTTYYLAKLNGSNPIETKSIDKLKKLMR